MTPLSAVICFLFVATIFWLGRTAANLAAKIPTRKKVMAKKTETILPNGVPSWRPALSRREEEELDVPTFLRKKKGISDVLENLFKEEKPEEPTKSVSTDNKNIQYPVRVDSTEDDVPGLELVKF